MTSIRVRATSRSCCVVILALASSPGTTTTRPPIASTSEASSVPSRSSSWARRSMPAANACGVCTATRRSRSSVSATCPSSTTTAQTDMPVLLLLGRRDLALGGFGWVQSGEEHAPHRRLYVRGDTRRDLSAYEVGSARDDDHRAVVEEPDALPRLPAGAA